MSHKHERTLEHLFGHPPSMNIHWRDVVRMFEAMGAEVEVVRGGRQAIRLNGEHSTFSIPHSKAMESKSEIVALRHFLERAGVTPGHWPGAEDGKHAETEEDDR